jgi:MTH538 TIR-like domain (DUF1863)
MAHTGNHEQPFLYDAFISYRHVERDRKWAEWLIGALENYRVPKSLQALGVPPKLQKIFRDEDEIPASSDLNDQIKAALKASRFLIVVCSPYTPRSKWVHREIEIFNDLGRNEQVLALLTEGEPHDSFPTPMLERRYEVTEREGTVRTVTEEKEPLAADVRPRHGTSTKEQKRLALLRLVACILGVKFDDLRQRDHERELRRQRVRASIAAAVCVVVSAVGFVYWQLNRPRITHYHQLVWRWGLPEGVGYLDAEARSHLQRSYSVTTRRGRVLEARRENSAAELAGAGDSELPGAQWVVHYGDDGSAELVEVFDRNHRPLRDEVLGRQLSRKELVITFERSNRPFPQAAIQNLNINPLPSGQADTRPRTEITRHELTFDENGFEIERRYQDPWGIPQHDAQDSFGVHINYSPEGLVLRRAEIRPDGNEIVLKNGVRAFTFEYDREYNQVRSALMGADNRPLDGADGFSYFVREFDRWGNEVRLSYYGAEGKPTLHKDGYSKTMARYDERGNQTEVTFYDIAGQPTLHRDGFFKVTMAYDRRGNAIEEGYFGLDGNPTLHKNGYAKWTTTYDDRDHPIEALFFGIDGKPTVRKDGPARVTATYDGRGNLIEQAYFGVDGRPTRHKDGNAGVRRKFDERGNLVEVDHLDIDGRPTLIKPGWAMSASASMLTAMRSK